MQLSRVTGEGMQWEVKSEVAGRRGGRRSVRLGGCEGSDLHPE